LTSYAWGKTTPREIPTKPGVYMFRDGAGKVLYVGKACDLRARLRSYTLEGGDGRIAIRFLDRDARTVEIVITRTDSEALLLEDTLIKQHRPRHNVRLKDDKSFLMVRFDLGEDFPRPKFVRAHRPEDGRKGGRARFFGPYASTGALRRTLSDLQRVVPLRDCTDAVMNHRSRPCLKHQIGLCCAPCVDGVTADEYADHVARAMAILSGDTAELEGDLEGRMRAASEAREYERAGRWRDRLAALHRTVEGQGVRAADRVERVVVALARAGESVLVHRLAFRGGRMVESRSHGLRSPLDGPELLHGILTALYAGGRRGVPPEIVVPVLPSDAELLEKNLGDGVVLRVPRGGERRRMLDLALENARAGLAQREAARGRDAVAASGLAKLVGIETLAGDRPLVVDGFDISNTGPSNVVASRVRFRGGIPDRNGYRRFRVRTVAGQDDFASMEEVVGRSLRRGMDEGDLPDVVLIDGGAGQLRSALRAREDVGAWDVVVVSLAKARPEAREGGRTRKAAMEERLFTSPDQDPYVLPRHDDVRHLLERIRDEAHRFAITYHRKERGRIKSKLDSIPGVGPARRKALLRRFGSVVGVAGASVEEIVQVDGVGPALAAKILAALG